jgi:hypothetical protein
VAESDLNAWIQRAIRHRDPVRIENAVGPGTPDIEYVGGWIESKMLKAWPKRAATPVRVPHYVPEQRAWHVKRRTAGGRVHVVIQIASDVLVFDGKVAAQGLGFWTREEMNRHAVLAMYPRDPNRFRRFIDGLKWGETS